MCNAMAVFAGAAMAKGVVDAKAAGDQADADAQSLQFSAAMERLKAKDVRERGAQAEGLSRMKGSEALAKSETEVAASPIEMSGSPMKALADTRMMSELDALTIRNNAAREAWGHEVQAVQYDQAAKAKKKQGQLAGIGSFLGVAGSIGGAYLGGGKGKA